MVTEAQEYKTSIELLNIAHEMLVILGVKHDLTNGEISIVLFLMGDGRQYLNMEELIKKVVKQ